MLTKPLGHSLILFELTPESLKSEKESKIKPTPYVQWSNFDDFGALYKKGLKHCVHMEAAHLMPKQLNNVSAAFL